ncbi:MAG: YggS family pyridoxal phosphate-dependent enzyme [Firmicutes bacterium]|nr:YggS family pyridoxal phosphate-dependent enzyme [Bacillota bacterium]
MIRENLEKIKKRLALAAAKRGIPVTDITLIAVTKTVPPDAIREAWDLGVTDFGENRVQEALPKIKTFPRGPRWHFIGHLQTNKVKQVLPVFDLIHSVDSLKLARAIQKEGEKLNKRVNVLVQVNIGAEESKFGFSYEEVLPALEEMAGFSALKILGLMGIAPFFPDPEHTRPYFRRLYRLFNDIKVAGAEMKYLSMGMTNDFEVAIEEGANMVRLGTALFGPRDS